MADASPLQGYWLKSQFFEHIGLGFAAQVFAQQFGPEGVVVAPRDCRQGILASGLAGGETRLEQDVEINEALPEISKTKPAHLYI